jgi:ribosomal-protein-alanine N-acetyltransferase
MELIVRPMTISDVEEVYRINRSSFTTDVWSRDALEREFRLPYSKKYVIQRGDRILGYCVIWLIKGEAFIMSIAVEKGERGKGIGKVLMNRVIEDLKDKAEVFLLDVRKSNLPAIRLYRSLGFSVVKERKKFYSDGENALLMELKVDRMKDDEDKRQVPEAVN